MKIVMAHGVFSHLHEGHLAHLEQARSFGDRLVVSLVADQFIDKPGRQNEEVRRRMLLALCVVDCVLLTFSPGPEKSLRLIRPAIYVRGQDYKDKRMPENAVTDELGIECRFTLTGLEHVRTINLLKTKDENLKTGEKCPKCGAPMFRSEFRWPDYCRTKKCFWGTDDWDEIMAMICPGM